MSENINNNSDPSLSHELHAFEASSDAYETAVRALGKEAIREAEAITQESGVEAPANVVDEAESLTQFAGVTEPEETVKDAEAIIAHAMQVTNAGEELREGETLNTEVADGAENILHEAAIEAAYKNAAAEKRISYEKWIAHKWMLRKAGNGAEREAVERSFEERSKGGEDKSPE